MVNMNLRNVASQTSAFRKIIFDFVFIIILLYGVVTYVLQSIPPLYSYISISIGVAVILIQYFLRKRRENRAEENAAYVNEMWRPKSLLEVFREQTETEEIGDSLLRLKERFGEGFIELDVKIFKAMQSGHEGSKNIAVYLNCNEKEIKRRLKFLEKKTSLYSSSGAFTRITSLSAAI